MSDEKALLSAVWEHPHEDTPRLVFADWLQENGQPERAEFIRVQVELARLDEWDDSLRKAELERREESLWKKHGKTWRAGLPSPLKVGMFRRGFPDPPQQSATGKQFLAFPDVKLNAAPLWSFNLRQITDAEMTRIPASGVFGRTDKFMVWQQTAAITGGAVECLVASPNARNLVTLGLTRQAIGDAGVRAFVRSADLPNLTALYLGGTGITDEGVRMLGEWSGAERLRELMLDENALSDAALEVIAAGPLGRGLKSLLIGGNPAVTTVGLIRLTDSPAADSLERLNVVGSTAVMPAFAEALAASPRSQALRHLILCDTPLGDRGVAAVLDSPHLRNLRHFYVRGCRLRSAATIARLDATFGGGGYGSGVGGFRIKTAD